MLQWFKGQNWNCIQTFTRHQGISAGVNSVTFSPNGNLLASGSDDHTIKIWDMQKMREIQTLTGHKSVVRQVIFSKNNEILFSASLDRTINIWDLKTGYLRVSIP